MAEILLSAFISIVFEKLASAALDKIGQSIGIHSELQKLGESLRKIRALLNDASHKEITNENVKDWLNRLQHLAYDIDDLLDALATDAIHRDLTQESETTTMVTKVRKLIPSASIASTVRMFFPRFMSSQVHDKLNDITTRLQELYDEKNNLGLTVKDKRSSQDINRTYQTSLLPPGIVGRDGEKEILLQKLLLADDHEPIVMNQNKFSIVPIVGMGGIGKTTLARLLYNEPKVDQHFDLKAWVCVSDEFDSFKISKLIFESVAKEEKKFENPNLLQEALRNQLAGKRFLLVLDDVWTEKIEDWDTLVPPFHAVAPGSKIILTTRKEQLLQQLGYDNPYHLNKLSDDDALSLFAQHTLGANNFDSNPTLRPYGEGIVKKCDGLPVALKALGSLLRTKTNEEKWKELLESEIWSLQDRGGILPALRLSYLDLSACLKQLFAYSCLFPKDYMFDKEDLILLWMAEGFLLESSTSKSMECLGEEYFDELLSRSFFQHVPNDESLFMMHDLMNDLATSVAGEFFVRLDIEKEKDIREQTLEKELVVPDEPKVITNEAEKPSGDKTEKVSGGSKREVREDPGVGQKRKLDDAGTSHAKRSKGKVLEAALSKETPDSRYKLRDEDESQAPENQGFAPGRGKSMKFVGRLTGHDPGVEKSVCSLSSDDTESVTGDSQSKRHSPNFTNSPVKSSDFPLPNVEGPFVPPFTKVAYVSKLDSEDEREDFVMNSVIPARKREVEMMTNETFHDYANETLIRMMGVQSEHLRRFRLMDEDKDRLLRENNKLVKKLKKLGGAEVESDKVEWLQNALDVAKGDILIKEKQKESVEEELRVVKDQMVGVVSEKEEWKRRCEEAEAKVERFALDAVEHDTREKALTERNEALELSNQKLSEEVEKIGADRKILVSGYPQVIRKFLKSFEFAKEMGDVQNRAVAFGGHRGLGKIHARIPKLNVAQFEDYNPKAFDELVAAGAQPEDKDYAYITRLASSSDLSAEEILAIEPEPFPEAAA